MPLFLSLAAAVGLSLATLFSGNHDTAQTNLNTQANTQLERVQEEEYDINAQALNQKKTSVDVSGSSDTTLTVEDTSEQNKSQHNNDIETKSETSVFTSVSL